ncbi:MAG: aldo/keto reductase [Syntrophobacteraceae bacterium]|nr:aldo/keto reductase [Syntrophobacteraceae bacterium]
MSDNEGCSRRNFFKIAGALGAGSVFLPGLEAAEAQGETNSSTAVPIPVRTFGKTGVKVSCLGLGGMFDIRTNHLLLKQALRWGVTYWDTAETYEGGNSEIGIGQFLQKYPKIRKDIFLVTKSTKYDPDGLSQYLDQSLQRTNAKYIDLYFLHGINTPSLLGKDIRAWAEKAKSRGKIKFIGFSAHNNMEDMLLAASKLGWIDGIMLRYDFRLMRTDKMRRAVDACAKAGIGLTAMKTQGKGSVAVDSEAELELASRFIKRGFTDAQAKLKAVWEEPNIASICSQMPNMTILMSNVAAAMDKTRLTSAERALMDVFALETSAGYCAGCTSICEREIGQAAPVGDIMRFLMYYNSYGEVDYARACFAAIPGEVREKLETIDFSGAERLCPQKIQIAKLVGQAVKTLG